MIRDSITRRHVVVYGPAASLLAIAVVRVVGFIGIYASSLAFESSSVPNVLVPSAGFWQLYADLIYVLTGALFALWAERMGWYMVRQLD